MSSINPLFSDDFHRFVLQDQPIPKIELTKKFSLNSSKKDKKFEDKEDSPWIPKKPKDETATD